jgi:hypothetical protein
MTWFKTLVWKFVIHIDVSALSSLMKFCHEVKFKNLKMKWFWRVSITRNEREKKRKTFEISSFGFQCVAKNIEGWLKIYTS